MKDRKKLLLLPILAIPGLAALGYLAGLLAQLLACYEDWIRLGGMGGQVMMEKPSLDPLKCYSALISRDGLKSALILLGLTAVLVLYIRFHDRFSTGSEDPRGFSASSTGTYGTAAWMNEAEMRSILEISPIGKAVGTVLGEYKGKAVCMPKDTRLNRHIAIFGASGTMKSRAIIRNALFQDIKRGESVIITDSKGELYADTSELFRKNGYDVKVFNLVNPEHGDSWNCMSDLNGDTLMAQILTNVIIGNTSSGKSDHFWDGGEGNLLKALILYVDQDPTRADYEKNLSEAYNMLTQYTEMQLTTLFERLPVGHPARAPFHLFSQSSDSVKSGTSAKKLIRFGKPRPDGKSLSRTAQLFAGSRSDTLLFVASSGPGVENATGLIVPKFGKNPEQHVAVSMAFDGASRLFLLTRIHYDAWLTAWYMREAFPRTNVPSGRETGISASKPTIEAPRPSVPLPTNKDCPSPLAMF